MFDTYMDAHALDPGLRRRMTLALSAAVIASAVAVGGYSGLEKLSVRRVAAPNVEIEFLMATTVPLPLAAPPPASPPTVASEAAAVDPDPDPDPTRESPPDVLEPPRQPTAAPGTHRGLTVPGVPGVPGIVGPPGGIVGVPCPTGACVPTRAPPVPLRADPTSDSAKVPLSVVESRLRFSPDPPREALLGTRAATARRGGTSVVEFCVSADGKVDKVATRRSAGDADVDRICRETLRRWRFSPLTVQGRATRMCSEFSFVIAFE